MCAKIRQNSKILKKSCFSRFYLRRFFLCADTVGKAFVVKRVLESKLKSNDNNDAELHGFVVDKK